MQIKALIYKFETDNPLTSWMNPPTGSAHALVLLHQINQPGDGLWLEINVSVQGEQVGVLGHDLLPLVGDGQLHELEAEEIVHVHALGPALLVSDDALVLEVAHDLGLSREGPHQAAAVWSWVLLWWTHL